MPLKRTPPPSQKSVSDSNLVETEKSEKLLLEKELHNINMERLKRKRDSEGFVTLDEVKRLLTDVAREPTREYGSETDFDTFKEEVKTLIASSMAAHHEEIKKIYPTLMEIKNTNSNIENTVAHLAAQNDELRKKIDELELQIKKDKDYIIILEDKLENMERSSRKASIEIKNVPRDTKESKEDLIKMTLNLSKAIGYSMENKDIRDIYRVKGKKGNIKNNPVIVELASTVSKTDFLKMTKTFNAKHKEKLCARHLGLLKDEYSPVFVAEHLTAKAARLYYLARDLGKSKGYRFCWTAYGRVYIRENETSPIIHITSESQVNKLLQA